MCGCLSCFDIIVVVVVVVVVVVIIIIIIIIIIGLGDRRSKVRFPVGAVNFSLHHRVQNAIQWVPGALSLGVKQPGREADHSPLSSAEVKE
jgi:hypothetical protein